MNYNDSIYIGANYIGNNLNFKEMPHVRILEIYKFDSALLDEVGRQMVELYGYYYIKYAFMDKSISGGYIGIHGSYIVIDGIKYYITDETISKITTILYNRKMNEAIDSL